VHRTSRQSAVELALSVPLLIVLPLAAVEFGRIFYTQISVTNAARAGVQYGAQNITTASDTNGTQQAALADAPNITGLTATASHFCQCANDGASTCLATDRLLGQSSPALRQSQHECRLHADDELSRPARKHDAHWRGDDARAAVRPCDDESAQG
jgi:hypothetical protein